MEPMRTDHILVKSKIKGEEESVVIQTSLDTYLDKKVLNRLIKQAYQHIISTIKLAAIKVVEELDKKNSWKEEEWCAELEQEKKNEQIAFQNIKNSKLHLKH